MSDAKTPKPIALRKFKPKLSNTSLARIYAAALPPGFFDSLVTAIEAAIRWNWTSGCSSSAG